WKYRVHEQILRRVKPTCRSRGFLLARDSDRLDNGGGGLTFMIPSIPVTLIGLLLAAPPDSRAAAEKIDLSNVSVPAELLAPQAKPAAAAVVCFLEGPAVDAEGNVFFSDIAGNRILKMTPDGNVVVFRSDSGRANGNAFDAQGRLISCEGGEHGRGGRRRIVRTDLKTGKTTVLTDRYQGKRYNSPNDVCVDAKGRIWFTDPRYGQDRS